MLDHSAISSHWWKFKHWIKDIMLHENSDCLKLSNEFITAHQHMNEDSNQFHLHLFNLEIQSECTVSIKDYKMYLIEFLQNIIIQQDHTYFTVQDLITHADKLWQTLDSDKVHQEIKNERACYQCQSDQHDQSDQSDWSDQLDQSEQYSNQAERRLQDSQSTANLSQWLWW